MLVIKNIQTLFSWSVLQSFKKILYSLLWVQYLAIHQCLMSQTMPNLQFLITKFPFNKIYLFTLWKVSFLVKIGKRKLSLKPKSFINKLESPCNYLVLLLTFHKRISVFCWIKLFLFLYSFLVWQKWSFLLPNECS